MIYEGEAVEDFDDGQQKQVFHDYSSQIKLKPDHEKCPLWIAPDNRIFLEAFSPMAREATEFLIAIAEPTSRPTYIHEYVLTPYSLYAAVSVGLTEKEILVLLSKLAKNDSIPNEVKQYIELYSSKYGKARLVLKQNKYFIETVDRQTRDTLLGYRVVSEAYEAQIVKNKEIEAEKERMRP
jgi:DNA excision repair protein ERCC-3